MTEVLKILYYWVGAEVLALAGFTMLAHPDFVKLVHGLFYDFGVIGQNASLKVSFIIRLHTDTGTSKVCTTDIYFFTVKDKHLEMNTRTKHTFQAVVKNRVLIKVLTKVWTWFFCMNEPYLHTTPNELGYK